MMIQENVSLKPYNSFRIEARARHFARFASVAALEELLPAAGRQAPLVLGGGSNILLTKDVDGLVLKNELAGIEVVREDEDHVYVKAGAGENWHGFVQYCVGRNYAGVENLSLIPGNVGASPMQNIGAYGVEVKDVFHELEAFHLGDKKTVRFSLADCGFGYRESVFKGRYKGQFVITSVTYRLNKKPVLHTGYGAIRTELGNMGVSEPGIRDIAQAVIHIRSAKLPDPRQTGNAGSFFKNPLIPAGPFEDLQHRFPSIVAFPASDGQVKLAAGWLIEQCGWKGYREGDAGCYSNQALVLVNYGHATGAQIFALSEKIMASVHEKFGVLLEREVNVVG